MPSLYQLPVPHDIALTQGEGSCDLITFDPDASD